MRTFERTHPWISFRCDLGKAGVDLWLALGEAASKCEHIARVPLRPATAQALHRLYLAKGAAATTAIEGNTLSEENMKSLSRFSKAAEIGGRQAISPEWPFSPSGETPQITEIDSCQISLKMAFSPRDERH